MNQPYELDELNFETTIGAMGEEDNSRQIPVIDFNAFEKNREQITQQLWQAATEVGFFQIKNHSISLEKIEAAFKASEAFFALEKSIKAQFPLKEGLNAGWEFRAQVRPSTGTADEKESYQYTLPHMQGLWPSGQLLAGFKQTLEEFERLTWQLNMQVLSCFATQLGFSKDFFTRRHQRDSKHYQSTLRLLHYLPMAEDAIAENSWRAGAHTDFDCLTMVFQQPGQGGLQVCPGKDAHGKQVWTSVEPKAGVITCNIGDMLTRWSDDQLKSTLHRVKMPSPEQAKFPRYSIAFFAQANKDQIIQGPKKKYPPISAEDFLLQRIQANFKM